MLDDADVYYPKFQLEFYEHIFKIFIGLEYNCWLPYNLFEISENKWDELGVKYWLLQWSVEFNPCCPHNSDGEKVGVWFLD